MGVILPQTIEIVPTGKSYKYYKEKGYIMKNSKEKIIVNVIDLPKKSNKRVLCKCDDCKSEFKLGFNHINNINITYCRKCNIKRTSLERYGVEHFTQNEKVKEKFKKTNLDKYGVEHFNKNEKIKEKIKNTFLQKYGVDNCMKIEEIKIKIKNTNLKKYGTEHPFQNEEVKNKYKNTSLIKYGVEHPTQNNKVIEKRIKTNLKKYGCKCVSQKEKIKKKIKNTNLKRYGCGCVYQNERIKEKIKNTNLEKYGVEYPSQMDWVREKNRETFIKNFKNNGIACSKPQRYLNNLLNGELNKPIKNKYCVDIMINKFVIEYDGSGHFIQTKNGPTLEEFYLHEKEREQFIINNGFKIIRIINMKKERKDKLPEDNIILNTIEIIKNNLLNNDYKIARWNLADNSIIYE